jgi:hypothetical protein
MDDMLQILLEMYLVHQMGKKLTIQSIHVTQLLWTAGYIHAFLVSVHTFPLKEFTRQGISMRAGLSFSGLDMWRKINGWLTRMSG